MTQITRVRALRGMGILADLAVKDRVPQFLRYNLIYGFNGSGKSTLSRLFSCLESRSVHPALPKGCDFELELADGNRVSTPDLLGGLEDRICVFNVDFIDRNLRWADGTANSIFYISEQQVEAAAALRAAEAGLPGKVAALTAAENIFKERSQTLTTFKRGLAKIIASKIHLANRKYEAPQLQSDYAAMTYDATSLLKPEMLDEYESVANRSSPPPRADSMEVPLDVIAEVVETANQHASVSVGDTMIAELTAHSYMVPWARTGHEYHAGHDLKSCLFCGQNLTEARKAALAAAFNDAFSRFISALTNADGKANAVLNRVELALIAADQLALMPEFKSIFQSAISSFADAMPDMRDLFAQIKALYESRKAAPTSRVEAKLSDAARVAEIFERVRVGVEAINEVIRQHNEAVADFAKHQQAARDAIKRHFLADGHAEYESNANAVIDAQTARDDAADAHTTLQGQIKTLRARVHTHGPAAEAITKLVKAYLGHGELTVVPADQGYELHRHGKLVQGPPSEGEKTALALCYFLSTLGSDGRKLKDLIVVIDDPISSLDTKAMNYACALIRTRLRDIKQLFVLTHNQHCMNEFKKDWRSLAIPRDPAKTPQTAMLLYLDVKIPPGAASRSAMLVEMPPLLREYDSEYHFLCMKVLEFEAAGATDSEYGYLMPNIIRRVLELFLAFKVPGTSPIKDKLTILCKLYPELDKTRMAALERLSQVESHSDSIDDFIAHSSMTIEEAHDANAALLELMKSADERHTIAIRQQCRRAA